MREAVLAVWGDSELARLTGIVSYCRYSPELRLGRSRGQSHWDCLRAEGCVG